MECPGDFRSAWPGVIRFVKNGSPFLETTFRSFVSGSAVTCFSNDVFR